MWERCRWVSALAAFAALACNAPGAAASERSVRVGSEYFGVNYPLMAFDSAEVRERQLRAISAAGIESVRIPFSWHQLEPRAPDERGHDYQWWSSDLQVTLLARHGLRAMPAFFYPPSWASTRSLRCRVGSLSGGTDKPGDYADAAAALALRYGPRGSFWAEHPELPAMPITTWQLWNEPNLDTFWCPDPDPGGYADLFVRAATAIKEARRKAQVITAGLIVEAPRSRFVPVTEFLGKATAARPDLWRVADAVGAHIYPGASIDGQFAFIASLRGLMTAGGVPKREPMFGSEVGWGLGFGLSEGDRAALYRYVTERMPSTNCNVGAMFAHAWTTTDPTGIFYDNATGIADVSTGELLPSAVAFRDTIAILRGEGPREAIHPKMRTCAGMPLLNRDGDRRSEHRDYYPLDRKRSKGPPEWHGKPVVTAKRIQRLGKPVRVTARCGQPCTLLARATIRLDGARGGLRLKHDRARAPRGKTTELTMRPGRKAARTIRRSAAQRGNAAIEITAIHASGDRGRARTAVKLR